jgi:hypothetical protein
MHAIFRQVPNEPLQAWIHLDGHGSQTSGSRMAHLGEFLYHQVTFQNNDQQRMFENLQRSFSSSLETSPDPATRLTERTRLTLFTDKTLTQVQPYAASMVSSAVLELFSPSRVWGQGTDLFTNPLVASFTQRLVTYGIQSGAAAALHEDLRYRPSNSRNIWKRSGHALFSTITWETPRGNDIALANIVAAVGSAEVINITHPGRENPDRQGTWSLAGENLLGFAEGNLGASLNPTLSIFCEADHSLGGEPSPAEARNEQPDGPVAGSTHQGALPGAAHADGRHAVWQHGRFSNPHAIHVRVVPRLRRTAQPV